MNNDASEYLLSAPGNNSSGHSLCIKHFRWSDTENSQLFLGKEKKKNVMVSCQVKWLRAFSFSFSTQRNVSINVSHKTAAANSPSKSFEIKWLCRFAICGLIFLWTKQSTHHVAQSANTIIVFPSAQTGEKILNPLWRNKNTVGNHGGESRDVSWNFDTALRIFSSCYITRRDFVYF